MRILIFLSLLLCHAPVWANCQVFIPEKDFLHDSGYSLSFDFSAMLSAKNYVETYDAGAADYELHLEGIEHSGRFFHHAVGQLELVSASGESFKASESVRCFTQFCALSDYARAFNKSYKKLTKLIPRCL